MERNETLLIFGPKGTRSLTDHILSAYQDDIQYRLKDLEPTNKLGYTVDVKEISGGSIYKDKLWTANTLRHLILVITTAKTLRHPEDKMGVITYQNPTFSRVSSDGRF
jgi:hypothetical protein